MKRPKVETRLKTVSGLNVCWPWAELLVSGKKTIETRNYPLPLKHEGNPIAIIQTPGRNGKKQGIKRASIVGFVVFEKSKKYESEDAWKADFKKHLVPPGDKDYTFKNPKYGWVISSAKPFNLELPQTSRRGIVFATNITLPKNVKLPS